MQLAAYDIALIAGGFGIVGSLLGVLLSYRFALKIASANFNNAIRVGNISAYKEASNNLRAAFAPQLSAFRLDQEMSYTKIEVLLGANINSLKVEMEKFRFYVSSENLSAYDEACEKYQSIARIRAMNYEAFEGKKPFNVFEAMVNDVLQFTKL